MRYLAAVVSAVLLAAMLAGCGGEKPAQAQDGASETVASAQGSAPSGSGVSPSSPVSQPGEPVSSPSISSGVSAAASAKPKTTSNLQGESQQALDDLNQALKELEDINSNGDTGDDIDGLN